MKQCKSQILFQRYESDNYSQVHAKCGHVFIHKPRKVNLHAMLCHLQTPACVAEGSMNVDSELGTIVDEVALGLKCSNLQTP